MSKIIVAQYYTYAPDPSKAEKIEIGADESFSIFVVTVYVIVKYDSRS